MALGLVDELVAARMNPSRERDLVERGRDALGAREWATAHVLFREADAAGELGPSDVENLAEAAFWTGHLEECIAARERAYRGLVACGDDRSAALVALHLAFHHSGRAALAVAAGWLESALELLRELPPCAEQGWAEWVQAVVAVEFLVDHEGAVRHAERAEEIGRAVGDRDVEALGRLAKGGVFVHLGRVEEGLALLDRVMAAAVSGVLGPWASAATYCGAIRTCAVLGDYRRAAEWIDEVRRREGTTRACEFPGDCRLHRAQILQLRGEWAEAEVEAARACDELETWDLAHVAQGLHELGMVALRRGDLAGAETAFRQTEMLGGSPQPGRALLELTRGRPATAWASLEDALDATGDDALGRAQLLPTATEAALAAGDPEAARQCAEELARICTTHPTETQDARAARARGDVAAATGELDLARRELADAARRWKRIGAPYEEAKTRVSLARVLRACGEHDAADFQLQPALEAFERLGATLDAAQTLELSGRSAPQTRVVRTFMFTDIEGSTALLAGMGDDRWAEHLRWHDATLRRLFARFHGQEIKQRGGGDGFFVAFVSAEAALDCALEIQHAMKAPEADGRRTPLVVRIGVHEAEATYRLDDYSGRGVHEAARISSLARGGEILASVRTLESAGSHYQVSDARSVQLRGLEDPVMVASVSDSDDEAGVG